MAAIKRFFDKKKLDFKFKKAGGGQKLTEPVPSKSETSQPSSSQSSSYQRTLSNEARMAAEAAAARIAQPKAGVVGTGKDAIRAQIRRELEAEKKALAAAKAQTYQPPEEVVLDGSPVLSTAGVFFKCPMIGPMVLPKSEMEDKIKEFLLTQLAEEPSMTSALMIQTLNKDREKVKTCIETLNKYLDNILSHPGEEKFTKIRIDNKAFKERIVAMEGGEEFVQSAGFQQKMLTGPNGVQEEFYVLDKTISEDTERLQGLKEILAMAEPIKPELDRSCKVFYPSSKVSHIQVPDEFYAIKPDELKREQQLRTDAVEKLGMLRTKEMRARDQMRELRKYRYTLIRTRFPDGVILQGTFKAHEKLSALYNFIRDQLETSWMPFVLTSQTGLKLTEESQTLAEQGLVPAAVLHFAWDSEVQAEIAAAKGFAQQANYLNDEVMAAIQHLS